MGKGKKKDISISAENLKKLGFDVKLTKEDLFDLVIEEMTQKHQARLEQLKQEKVSLGNEYSAFSARFLAAAEVAVKANPLYVAYVTTFPAAELRDMKVHIPGVLCHHVGQDVYVSIERVKSELYVSVEVYDKSAPHNTRAKLSLSVPATDADANEYKRLYDRGVDIGNEKHAVEKELCQLEHSPRKAKIAMLRQMLNGTELGKNLLDTVGQLNKNVLTAKSTVG